LREPVPWTWPVAMISVGDRQGQYSIRINQQWRMCFEWPLGEPAPFNIEITDYHK
jgi:proteic killer suppression protein